MFVLDLFHKKNQFLYIRPDEYGMYKGLIVPKEFANIVYYYSFLFFPNSLYGIYRGHFLPSLVPLSVGITSLLYWKNPKYNWKRYLDMTACAIGNLYTWV